MESFLFFDWDIVLADGLTLPDAGDKSDRLPLSSGSVPATAGGSLRSSVSSSFEPCIDDLLRRFL